MKSPKSGRVEKMSKSKGNVVNPDEIVQQLGADTLRLYMLFMGPPELDTEWQMESINGVHSFIGRLWHFLTAPENRCAQASPESYKAFHRFFAAYDQRIDNYKVNTAVASVMEYLNVLTKNKLQLDDTLLRSLLSALSIMIPHVAAELLELLLNASLADCRWPIVDSSYLHDDTVTVVVQINGKLRAQLLVDKSITHDELVAKAREAAARWLIGDVIKTIVVPEKLVNFVVKV
jgi:leucyl-tRNA synthetase